MDEPRAFVERLETALRRAEPRLREFPDAATVRPLSPGGWSPREVLGHLIDSASNNHRRFVLAALEEELVFPGYAQDDWVAVQQYAKEPWPDLVTLFVAFNRHLAHLMRALSGPAGSRPRARHNLHELAFGEMPAGEPVTLDAFMADYVEHLRHHLDQVLGRSPG